MGTPGATLLARLAERRLTWLPQLGIGYYPVECEVEPYDQDYFAHFARVADTDLGRALMAARCDLVARHWDGAMIDIGIGSGAFIMARTVRRRRTFGYDVNPVGLEWLKARGLFVDPYRGPVIAASLWDVLEHMPDFRPLLAQVREWLFLSLPIFRDAEHVLRSKHFKPREHCWHFSRDGLLEVMRFCGFDLVEESDIETRLGREDIGTFAFRRQAC